VSAKVWSSNDAKVQFDALVEAAAKGEPQHVRMPNGTEVIVLSKEQFYRSVSSLKMALLTGGAGHAGDALDDEVKDSQ
jgi:hypothetical protein